MSKRNTFAAWQEKNVADREKAIAKYLSVLKRTKAKYQYVTNLAEAVAEHISQLEGKPCSSTTILRNKRYKAQLLSFLANQSGSSVVPPEAITDDRAKAVLISLQLELRNIRDENERLKAYAQELDGELDRLRGPLGVMRLSAKSDNGGGDNNEVERLQNDLASVCKALWLLLEHFKDIMSADYEAKRILDLSAFGDRNIVVDSRTAEPFFTWLRNNQGVGR